MSAEDDPLAIARAELAPGERLVWADRPDPARSTRRRWPAVVFGLVFMGFAAVWTFQAMAAGAGSALFGLVFLVLGLAVMARALWRRPGRRTVYAITDRRLLIIRAGATRRVRSFQPGDISTLERRERPDGSGDVVFARETLVHGDIRVRHDGPASDRFRQRETGFFGIADAQRVEAAIAALREGTLAS